MPTYTTEYVKNLRTGEPLVLEVPAKSLDRFEVQKRLIASGQSHTLGNLESLTQLYEFSFLSSYQEVLKIFFDNGFSLELMTQILTDFGADESFIKKLLEDEEYISEIKPWFQGITCDGERAARTLSIVYEQTKAYYSLRSQPRSSFLH